MTVFSSLAPEAEDPAEAAARHRLEKRPAPLDAAERAELLDFQRSLAPGGQVDALARSHIDALGHPDTFSALTGQQCGLLGGPLYAFIKAASAVATAKALSEKLGRRVAPIYWLAGDDHDFEEIRSFAWVESDGGFASFALEAPEGDSPRVPASERHFAPGDADALAEAIERATHPTEFRGEILAFAREISSPEVSLETHSGRLMAKLFAGSGLVFAAPRLNFIRRRGAKLLSRELDEPLAATRLVIEAGERLKSETGQDPALHRSPDALNFFVLRGRERCRARWSESGPEIEIRPGEWEAVSADALRAEMEEKPENFSPNVVTRPATQDAVFPTLAYVGGPGERAYFRQLREAYDHFGVAMPWIAARPGLTLVEPRARRSLDKLEATVAEVIQAAKGGPDRERELLLGRNGSGDFIEAIERLQSAMATRLADVETSLPKTYTRSRGALEKLGKQLEGALERTLNAARQDADQVSGDLERHLAKAKTLLAPGGKPQERVLNIVAPFLVNYGWQFAWRLRDLVPAAGVAPAEFRVDLPLEDGSRAEPIGGASPEAKLWQGADI